MRKPRNPMVCDIWHGGGLQHMVISTAVPCRWLPCTLSLLTGTRWHWVWLGKPGTSCEHWVHPNPVTLALMRGGGWGGVGWHRSQTTVVMMKADGSGDTSQDRKVFVRRAEPMPTARAARDGQIRESSSAAGRGIFHIASIPRGGRRCRNPLSPLIKTHKREKEWIKLI